MRAAIPAANTTTASPNVSNPRNAASTAITEFSTPVSAYVSAMYHWVTSGFDQIGASSEPTAGMSPIVSISPANSRPAAPAAGRFTDSKAASWSMRVVFASVSSSSTVVTPAEMAASVIATSGAR